MQLTDRSLGCRAVSHDRRPAEHSRGRRGGIVGSRAGGG
jgi:hypothetical protein